MITQAYSKVTQGKGNQGIFTQGKVTQSNIIHTITQGKVTLQIQVIIINKQYKTIYFLLHQTNSVDGQAVTLVADM